MSGEKSSPSGSFMANYGTSDEYCQAALKAIALATKTSNALPSDNAETWSYYSTFKDFRRVMNKESQEVWRLLADLLTSNSVKAPSKEPGTSQELLDLITEVNDHILERIHSLLDEAEGLKSKDELHLLQVTSAGSTPLSGSWNRNKGTSTQPVLITAKNVLRPQLHFQSHIDNSLSPFIPKLKDKPHGLRPLSILLETDESGEVEFYSHPYAFEISRLKLYPELLQPEEPSPPIKLQDVPCDWVDSLPALEAMIQELQSEKVIALDLEAHNYRSFMGITCLLQFSSSSKDYLLDPFPIWGELSRLNEILAHPRILKVLHGCDSDVLWLQRDFSLYLVNVFDTFRASLLLEFPKGSRSLKSLLSRYVGVTADKQYQLADWRIRPLPQEMKKYAREDTRYLIHIYGKMKQELLNKSGPRETALLRAAHERSNDICCSRFEKPGFHDMKHLDLLKKNKRSFNSKQLFALKEIYVWRHRLARKEDESEHYILPNHMLLNICSELPREMQGILALCNPVPPHVKQNLGELHKIVYEARGKPLTSNSVMQDAKQEPSKSYEDRANNDVMIDPLKCPLDLSQHSSRDKLPTVLEGGVASKTYKRRRQPIVNIWEKQSSMEPLKEASGSIEIPLSPFQRYRLLLPYLQSQKEGNEGEGKTDKERMESIKRHFEELTSIETTETMVLEEDEEAKAEIPKSAPKRPKTNESSDNPPPKKAPRDFDSYDLSQLSQSPAPNPHEYNPSKQFTNKHVNNKKSNKNNKRFNKSGSRSHSYKK